MTQQKENGVVRCYCLSRNGKMHCPLTTERKDLEQTFNYRVQGEEIIWVDIDKKFVCPEERKPHCKNCPFK